MVKKLIVAKFGGTSVADFNTMSRSADLIVNNSSIRLIVLSASANITNILVSLSAVNSSKVYRSSLINKIRDIQTSIINKLISPNYLYKLINDMIKTIETLSENASYLNSKELKDEILSYGELMSSLIFVEILREKKVNVDWFDVRNVMKTNDHFGCAQPDINIISRKVKTYLEPLITQKVLVTQGFIGQEGQGRTTTLGRGGSDYTAALLGEALKATGVEIWTDVPGIYTTDPHLIPTAKRIDQITFKEAAEMATFGAKILHPSTLLPAERSDIPVFVSSSQNPKAGGTYISNNTKNIPLLRALSLRRKQILLTLNILDYYNQSKILSSVFNKLLYYDIPVGIITSTKSNISLTINDNEQVMMIDKLLIELETFCKVHVEHNLSLIAIIGNNLPKASGISNTIFKILKPFSLRLICSGASDYNIIFVVQSMDADKIIRILHQNLFE
ncbi:lysine-sensitive aspartokinase 3 [Candidatus Pantoea edessiphila]|uniref:Aspartokinase n=1 Tax=Candidatus Pantoea edessiphila TaxID=2044610 RepID=A0A2P5SYD2_9GAMM|nr:lysine-sensitive aspartokinase 3 [Candidatus Pantoea edessiphila]MBK4775883.1 lysine-sensitive aspartokinase 3 [Pantoea sp. Edef]PPI87313.1 lysine-sensitive aspartokinase 3 [Candidatus Pantoea edessiphila]